MRLNGGCARLVAVLGLVHAASLSLQAQELEVDCREGGVAQQEMNVCAGREAEAAEVQLERLLAELRGRLATPQQEELERIQADWVAVRERDCQWERSVFEGGSVAPMVYANCITQLTQQRIDRLKVFLCEGSGMTGPCEESEKY